MWVEFVGSLLCSERFFSGYYGFPLSSKTNIIKFQFDPGMHGHFWTSSCQLLGALWVIKLPHFYFTLIGLATRTFDAARTVSEGPVGDGRTRLPEGRSDLDRSWSVDNLSENTQKLLSRKGHIKNGGELDEVTNNINLVLTKYTTVDREDNRRGHGHKYWYFFIALFLELNELSVNKTQI